jgi:hypothetical protein
MSNPKITPKNLSYNTSLPPFLQRLHNSSTTNSASLDGRHERAIARPKRARDADADKEDEPVFVDEETGEVVSAEEFKALGAGREGEQVEAGGDGEIVVGETEKEERGRGKEKEKGKHAAIIGASRKRKAAKVVGGDESAEEEGTRVERRAAQSKKEAVAQPLANGKKAKAKGKKVKLSFGDDEGG